MELIKKKLTLEEIEAEIGKVRDFFAQIPEEHRARAAELFIREIVLQGARDYYQAVGIFQEALLNYREDVEQWTEMSMEAEYEQAKEFAQDYCCVEEISRADGKAIAPGEICKIAFAGEDTYEGGKKYYVYSKEGANFEICQSVLNTCFKLYCNL